MNVVIVAMELHHFSKLLDLTMMTSSSLAKLFLEVKAHPGATCCSNLVNTAPVDMNYNMNYMN